MTNQIGLYDFETGKNIVRDMNDEELADHELRLQQTAKDEKEYADKIAEREALLTKLGITSDEAKLLLG